MSQQAVNADNNNEANDVATTQVQTPDPTSATPVTNPIVDTNLEAVNNHDMNDQTVPAVAPNNDTTTSQTNIVNESSNTTDNVASNDNVNINNDINTTDTTTVSDANDASATKSPWHKALGAPASGITLKMVMIMY
ncbi:hypothetical protein MOO45_01130 [Bombilactobacillus folatiphilus]|uniref:Uncharacterized protein n=1 Tax=Bombilactobacillus folatiphilus TaxID=2923362 RepID=A0ABY4P9X4_9LACO|nr:hypothetical protein [Bombilactobacillus folatiphilus]UQS82326.1 hypothetical protein MOO45_01130 [Bombilactobacillus folatiphilus]